MEHFLDIIPVLPVKIFALYSCTGTIQNHTLRIVQGERIVFAIIKFYIIDDFELV